MGKVRIKLIKRVARTLFGKYPDLVSKLATIPSKKLPLNILSK